MNISNLKKYIIPILIAIIIAGLIAVYPTIKGIEPTNLNMLGGGPTFGKSNTKMAEFNTGINTQITILSEDKITNYDGDWSNVDLIQAGSISTVNDIRSIPGVQVFGEIVMSTSPNMLWVKSNNSQDDLTPLIDARYIQTIKVGGQTVYLINSEKASALVKGAVENKRFNDPSINVSIDANINFGFPNSSGGRTSASQLISCFFNNCKEMITSDAIVASKDKDGKDIYNLAPEYNKVLIALYERSGKQPADEYSVDYCYNWLNQKTNSVRISIFPESCYTAWAITNAGKEDLIEDKGNVGIYLTETVVNTFTIIAVSEKGKEYIDTLANNSDFFQVVSESTGMRGAGIVSIPPVQFGDFIAPNEPYQQITFPFGQLTTAIKNDLKAYGK